MTTRKIELMDESYYEFESGQDVFQIRTSQNQIVIEGDYEAIFGLGERFNSINHKGFRYSNLVEEQFCNQKEKTYFPLPFFYTNRGWGIFLDISEQVVYDFSERISISVKKSIYPFTLYMMFGSPLEMVQSFIEITGNPLCPPKWAFGPWISGHRWNSEKLVLEQLDSLERHKIPATVMVLEQWSDEATFYIFNQAKYKPQKKAFNYEDFEFDSDGLWPDPKGMIDNIHQHGMKLLLWQCPVIKKLGENESFNQQHALDEAEVISNNYVPIMPDGTPYKIPEGHWFPGSMIPDFTNESASKWWFEKRQYLLDIGVDGFKTDGGEFIYNDDCIFGDGSTGLKMVNRYAHEYVKAYSEFCGTERTLFSRAGYIGQQKCPIQWAGDQESTWSELKSVYNAGLSISSSGQLFWGFDIGGFSGELPSIELYKRAVQFAVFTPVMQLHSEPIGGQFASMRPTKAFINDRTPWNMKAYYESEAFIDEVSFYFNLRMNLLPSIYCEALKAVKHKRPLMQHGLMQFPDDPEFFEIHDQYFFLNMLIAPILNQNQHSRSVYLPRGLWFNLFNNKSVCGGGKKNFKVRENEILVFVPAGTAIVLNTKGQNALGEYTGNNIDFDLPLTIRCFGEKGSYQYIDERGNDFVVMWHSGDVKFDGQQVDQFNCEVVL